MYLFVCPEQRSTSDNELQGQALQELKAKIELLEGDLDDHSIAVAAITAEKDANFSLLQEALQRAEVSETANFHVSLFSRLSLFLPLST